MEESVQTFLARFEANRRLMRITSANLLAAQGGASFPEAYQRVLIKEKEDLLNLLKEQLQHLKSLRTPAFILKEKTQDIRTVEAALNRLRKQKPDCATANLMKALEAGIRRDAVNVATRFVNDFQIYEHLTSSKGRAKMKRLLAE